MSESATTQKAVQSVEPTDFQSAYGMDVHSDLGPCTNAGCLHVGMRYEGVRFRGSGITSSCPYCRPDRRHIAGGQAVVVATRRPLSDARFSVGWQLLGEFFRTPKSKEGRARYHEAIRYRTTDEEFVRAVNQATYSMQRMPTPQQIVDIGRSVRAG